MNTNLSHPVTKFGQRCAFRIVTLTLGLAPLALTSCMDRTRHVDVLGAARVQRSEALLNQEDSLEEPLSKTEVMQLIYGAPNWPKLGAPPLSEADYSNLCQIACRLQHADPEILAFALSDYVTHFETAFETSVDVYDEWSKPLLVLRVMYALPETEGELGTALSTKPMAFAGYSWAPLSKNERVALTVALPITWTKLGPRLTAARTGYNGGRYEAADEFRLFNKKFSYRKFSK